MNDGLTTSWKESEAYNWHWVTKLLSRCPIVDSEWFIFYSLFPPTHTHSESDMRTFVSWIFDLLDANSSSLSSHTTAVCHIKFNGYKYCSKHRSYCFTMINDTNCPSHYQSWFFPSTPAMSIFDCFTVTARLWTRSECGDTYWSI